MPNPRVTQFSVSLILSLLLVVSTHGLATSAVAKPATAPGVWMLRDPGCGGQHLARHPKEFGLTCDPVAWVEKVHWRTWGGAKARATGTINIADLNRGSSVADAPRLRFAATIVASQIVPCGRHRVYGQVRIHYRDKGKPRVASLPPPFECPKKEAEGAGLEEFSSPDRHVSCYLGSSPSAASCYAFLSRGAERVGTAQIFINSTKDLTYRASLDERGKVSLCSSPSPETPACFQKYILGLPVLRYGQWTEVGGVRCSSSQAGITCIKVSGVGQGHGFRVSKDEAVAVEA
ncbi:MAG TPA: hypothetical protein VJL81_06975 [Solirubrobacterales bacterium]|nr:hypothetical protein [Solirubrobacterales bacterium]